MNSVFNLLTQLPLYKMFRTMGSLPVFPLSVTVSVTSRCNSRCMTCFIWKKNSPELNKDEFSKIFQSLGRSPFYITFSGGEVFLRDDFVDICLTAYQYCRPKIITIPTNGLLSMVIPDKIQEILKICKKSKIVVNVSLDDIYEKHDLIRAVPGNFNKALETYNKLRSLKLPNLVLGVHTVVSKFNVKRIPQIYSFVMDRLKPDSYITEIAEEREELGTIGSEITPSFEEYAEAADFLIDGIKKRKFKGLAKITEAFRISYYDMVKRILKNRKPVIPCYAGIASCHIAANGDVWACCIKCRNMGNLKNMNYDFKKIWFNRKAEEIRREIKARKCFCPLANASYTNILCNSSRLLQALAHFR